MTLEQVIMFRIEQVAAATSVVANDYLRYVREALSTGRHDHVAREKALYSTDRLKPRVRELEALFADLASQR